MRFPYAHKYGKMLSFQFLYYSVYFACQLVLEEEKASFCIFMTKIYISSSFLSY